MKKLTPNEIDRIIEALFKCAEVLTYGVITIKDNTIRTALSTIELDQPKIDLKEVHKLVMTQADSFAEERKWMARIGYTLSDLEGQENTNS